MARQGVHELEQQEQLEQPVWLQGGVEQWLRARCGLLPALPLLPPRQQRTVGGAQGAMLPDARRGLSHKPCILVAEALPGRAAQPMARPVRQLAQRRGFFRAGDGAARGIGIVGQSTERPMGKAVFWQVEGSLPAPRDQHRLRRLRQGTLPGGGPIHRRARRKPARLAPQRPLARQVALDGGEDVPQQLLPQHLHAQPLPERVQ